MTANEFLNLSMQIKDLLQSDLSHVFHDDIPTDLMESRSREVMHGSRERVFTPVNIILTVFLSATQEDKILQNGLNIFETVFESNCRKVLRQEADRLEQERANAAVCPRKP
jgi:hypothetical protein